MPQTDGYDEGWQDYENGCDSLDNRYDPELQPLEYEEWLDGWFDASENTIY